MIKEVDEVRDALKEVRLKNTSCNLKALRHELADVRNYCDMGIYKLDKEIICVNKIK